MSVSVVPARWEELPVQYCDLPDYRAAYRDTGGEGDTVIFLHALAGSGASWEAQLVRFREEGYRAIAPDRRGWGDSGTTRTLNSRVVSAADDLESFANALGLQSFHLVGVAGGGFVALDYAAWRTERINSLVVAASTGKFSEPKIQDFICRITNPAVPWPSIHLELGVSYLGTQSDGVKRWKQIFDHARRHCAPEQPLRSANTFDKIAKIDVPVLVLAGGADQLAPPPLMRLWAEHLPQCRFEIIGSAGHSINWEHPEEFNRLVLDFLASLT